MKNAKLIAKKYAQALYMMSKKHHKVSAVYEEMQYIQQIIDNNLQLSKFIYNKFAPVKETLVFFNIFIKAASYSDLIRNFLIVLKTSRRFFLLKLINSNFYDLVTRDKGITPVDVTTACPVDREIQEKIKEQIALLLKGKVDISMYVDKRILGGFIIACNSKILDLSLLAKVNKLERAFIK